MCETLKGNINHTGEKKGKMDMNNNAQNQLMEEIAEELNIKEWQVEATIKLIDEGNTIPFIARYRKEATGALNDEVLVKAIVELK